MQAAHPSITRPIAASRLLEALLGSGIDSVVTVPDWVQLALHEALASSPLGVTACCTEDQAVCVATGLRIGGAQPIVLIQNQGLYACMNALRATSLDAKLPTLFLIGQFGREDANHDQAHVDSARSPVRYLEPVLNVFGVRYWHLENEADLQNVATAAAFVHESGDSAALIVGTALGWS
jgi:sulfopyruvate decarboxylase TPP-binding subunit